MSNHPNGGTYYGVTVNGIGKDKLGANSAEVTAVKQSFDAVGVK